MQNIAIQKSAMEFRIANGPSGNVLAFQQWFEELARQDRLKRADPKVVRILVRIACIGIRLKNSPWDCLARTVLYRSLPDLRRLTPVPEEMDCMSELVTHHSRILGACCRISGMFERIQELFPEVWKESEKELRAEIAGLKNRECPISHPTPPMIQNRKTPTVYVIGRLGSFF